jgi:hypothetical protein
MKSGNLCVALVAALVVAAPLGAQAAATQTVNFEVDAINVMTTSGAVTLHITSSDVTAGASSTLSRTNATTTYAFTTNDNPSNGKTIEANLNSNMPSGVTLKITLATPGTGTSAGETSLTTSQAPLVTGITPTNAAAATITYKLEAAVTAGPQASASRTVSFTIIDTP